LAAGTDPRARLEGLPVAAPGFALFFFPCAHAGTMDESDRCELHEVAIFASEDETDDLLRVARSPIGDECQICPVCRAAREFVERRLAEKAGFVPPPGESADSSWTKLQTAVQSAKATIHKTA